MRARITKHLLDSLKLTGPDYYVLDTGTIGFAVRVRVTVGKLPKWTIRLLPIVKNQNP
jgi:hypothetical protein